MDRMRWAPVPSLFLACLIVGLFPAQVSARARMAGARSTPAPALPDTPAGRQLTAWLQALNGGDLQAMRAFASEHYTAAAPRAMTGITLVRVPRPARAGPRG